MSILSMSAHRGHWTHGYVLWLQKIKTVTIHCETQAQPSTLETKQSQLREPQSNDSLCPVI